MLHVFHRILCEQGLEADPTLGRLRIPMATAAVDVSAARLLVYTSETNPAMRVAELLRIATAIPLMYAPHESEGREVLDAALASYMPIWLATGQREELPIVALRVPPARAAGRRQLGGWLRGVLASGIASRDTFELERIPEVTVIDIPSRFSAVDFDLSAAEAAELIDSGRVAVADHFEREAERASAPGPPSTDDDRAEREAGRLYQRLWGKETQFGLVARLMWIGCADAAGLKLLGPARGVRCRGWRGRRARPTWPCHRV